LTVDQQYLSILPSTRKKIAPSLHLMNEFLTCASSLSGF
jgi:hypothetical protein